MKPKKVKLTYTLEAAWDGAQLTTAVSEVKLSAAARAPEVGDPLLRIAIWSLREYIKNRWDAWEEADDARAGPRQI